MLQRSQGAYGELCIRGAMVTNAYSMRAAFGAAAGKNALEGPTKSFWVEAPDTTEPFLRTRDLVMLVGSQNSDQALQVEFHGRCDQLVKVKGQFVDLTDVERKLRSALTTSTLATIPAQEQPGYRRTRTWLLSIFIHHYLHHYCLDRQEHSD